MKKDVKFSIIVPCYNVEKYIEECVNSVLHQTYVNWELLLIDDESKDNTLDIIRELENKDIRIHVYTKQHGGLPHTRNYGLNYVTGDYLALLDGDDYWAIDHLEKVNQIIEFQKYDMIIQNQHTNFTKEWTKKVVLFSKPDIESKAEERLQKIFDVKNYLPAAAVLTTYSLDFIKKNDLRYGEQYSCSEDLDFFLGAISKNPTIGFGYHEFYFYRQDNQTAMTKRISGKMELDRLSIYKKWFDYYSNNSIANLDSSCILKKISHDLCGQISVYHEIDKKDKQKKEVLKYLFENRYLFSKNGIGGSLGYVFLVSYPLNKIIEKMISIKN